MWRDSIHGQKPATYSRQQSLPRRARYDAYGVGLVVFVLLQAVERRLGIGDRSPIVLRTWMRGPLGLVIFVSVGASQVV